MELLKRLRGYGIPPRTVLHIGAHWGQEAPDYRSIGVRNALFVEAIPRVFEQLVRNLKPYKGFRGVCAVCSDRTGAAIEFNVASNDAGSSSMLPLGNHAALYPDIAYVETLNLTTITADDLVAANAPGQRFDLVVLDTQGAELNVLRGARAVLAGTKALLIEVSESPLYAGGCTFDQVTAHVRQFGFRLRQVHIRPQGWGDALYVRTDDRQPGLAGSWLGRSFRGSWLSARLADFRRRRQAERDIAAIGASPLFDRDWYLARYPDVQRDGIDPVRHYVLHGWRERRDPGPRFSTRRWIKENPGFEQAPGNPLSHHLRLEAFLTPSGRGRSELSARARNRRVVELREEHP